MLEIGSPMRDQIDKTLFLKKYDERFLSHARWMRNFYLDIDQKTEETFGVLAKECGFLDLLCEDKPLSTKERVVMFEALSYGDVDVALNLPSSSLAGVVIHTLATQKQKASFFSFLRETKSRTFLAITEPNKGSDTMSMETNYSLEGKLSGKKWLVGHLGTARTGVVMVRTGSGPFAVRSLLLTHEDLSSSHVERLTLKTLGLRGAMLGGASFNELVVDRNHLLGKHLPSIQRGLLGMTRTFNTFRPSVAMIAIGHAQAIVDYICLNFSADEFIRLWSSRLARVRTFIHQAADFVDTEPDKATGVVSRSKVIATRTCEGLDHDIIRVFGSATALEHPWLEKALRSAWAFEYMEGTSNIQHNHAAASLETDL